MADAESAFRGLMKEVQNGTVVKPLLHSYLYEAAWPEDFAVHFKKGTSRRKPDGWFHPSEHPLLPHRMLWFYLTEPDSLIPEEFAYMNTLSVTIGTAMHHFIETCLKHMGVMLDTEELEAEGFEVNKKNGEPQARDRELGATGHMDGVLRIHVPTVPHRKLHLFEFKTSNGKTLNKMEDLDLVAFMEKWPEYYAQAQEYLRMTGYDLSIVLFMEMGYPWTLKEFHIPANPRFQADTAGKYLHVRQAQASGIMPDPCCAPRSKEAKACPARAVCPIGKL